MDPGLIPTWADKGYIATVNIKVHPSCWSGWETGIREKRKGKRDNLEGRSEKGERRKKKGDGRLETVDEGNWRQEMGDGSREYCNDAKGGPRIS